MFTLDWPVIRTDYDKLVGEQADKGLSAFEILPCSPHLKESLYKKT